MKNIIAVFAVAALAVSGYAKPTVSNVKAAQDPDTRRVTVTYDLSEAAIVTIELYSGDNKINCAGRWAGAACTLCGAATGKKAWWRPEDNALTVAGKLTAKVNAWTESNPPDYMAVDFATQAKSYYASTNELPQSVASDYYRKHAMLFRRIPAAGVTYWMGSPSDQSSTRKDNEDYHRVTLTNDFYLGVFPVTQAQWKWAMNASTGNPSLQQGRPDSDLCPMDNISSFHTIGVFAGFPDGKFYVEQNPEAENLWVQQFQNKSGLKHVGVPTEAQWEYACRAGEGDATYDPTASNDELSWNKANSDGRTHPVGLKKPNAWGLYDMLGNVWEHCLDHYVVNLGTSDVTMPYKQKNYTYKTCRGGGFDTLPDDCLSARRTVLVPANQWGDVSTRRPNCGVRILVGIH